MAKRFERWLSRRPPQADLRYLHRLGFVRKRPKRRLVKASPAKRQAFVDQYRVMVAEAATRGEPIHEVLRTPGSDLRLMALPPFSPGYSAAKSILNWIT